MIKKRCRRCRQRKEGLTGEDEKKSSKEKEMFRGRRKRSRI